MRKVALGVAAFATLGLAGAAQADLEIFIDTDTDGVPVTFEFEQVTNGPITTVDWDVRHEAFSPSWGSEIRLAFLHVPTGNGFTAGGGDDATVDLNWGFADSSGVFTSSGSATAGELGMPDFDSIGLWRVTVDESFDDAGIDGHFTGTFIINKAQPAPGALALLGLAGLCGTRRRRS